MVTDAQVRRLREKRMEGKTLAVAAAAAGMSERTARTWQTGGLPSTARTPRTWRTRVDPFAGVWATEIVPWLKADREGRLQALTLFDELRARHPGQFPPGQLRTLQRRVRDWRALHGPDQEVYFEQAAVPGREGALDFTDPSDLGVTIQDLTPALAQAMGVAASSGAVVSQVLPQSAGAKAGIEEGDVIVALDGQPVTGSSQLRNEIGQRQPGTVVRLTLLRDGKEQSLTATLAPLTTVSAEKPASAKDNAPLSGMTLGTIPQDDPRYGKIRGVYVVSVDTGSAADEAGIQKGDIIVSANRAPISTPSELARIMQGQKKGTPLLLQIRRGDSALFVAVG